MKKNVLILLFAVCFAFTLFPCGVEAGWTATTVYVGDTAVSPADDGATHYWLAAKSGGSAYTETGSAGNYLFSTFYDRNTGEVTLTLNGIDITTYFTHNYSSITYNAGLYSDGDLNLVLQGDNTIQNSGVDYGIFCSNSLYIRGPGSLSVSDCIGYGLLAVGDDGGGIEIDGSTVEVTGGASGIRSLGSNSSIDIDSSTVTVTGQSRDGIIAYGDLTLEESVVNVDVNDIGISITGGLAVDDGASLVAIGKSGQALRSETLDFSSGHPYKYKSNTAASDPGGNYTFGHFVNSSDYKYVEIVNCPDVYVSGNNTDGTAVKVSSVADGGGISYWLNDGNGSITATGADSSHYNVKYEEKTHTLTLKDAVITKYYSGVNGLCGIYAKSDLHVVLEGDNQLGTAPSGENFDTQECGIYCKGNLTVSAASGATLDVYAEYEGLTADGSIRFNGGSIAISAVCKGVYAKGHDVTVTGEDTVLDITAGTTVSSDTAYGILAGSVTIADATVNVEKKGPFGDAIRSDDKEGGNICIYGDADVKIVDWSTDDEFSKCGLHSDEGNVAVGDTAKVDIVSQFAGIYAEDNLYIGYEPSGAGFAAVGDPTVKINDADSIAAVTPAVDNDFVKGYCGLIANGSLYFAGGTTEVQVHRGEFVGDGGCFGICAAGDGAIYILGGIVKADASGDSGIGFFTFGGNIEMTGGAMESTGDYVALDYDTGTLTLPTSYKYKSNTEASDPGGAYISGTYAYSAADKYVNIASVLDITKETASHGSYTVKTGADEVSSAAIGETVALTAAADSGYILSGWTVTKTGDPSVTVDVTDDTFTMPAYPVTVAATYIHADGVPYYVSGDKDIFIGFAANDKYIAPEGVTVLYKENKKTFTDVSGHWAADDIDFVTEREIFVGTGDGKFSPDLKMTRAMFVAVLGRLYERSYGEIAAGTDGAYRDCDYTSWYGKYVDWATENNIIYGYGNAKFGPNDVITREEMATMIYRFADFLDFLPSTLDTTLSYGDANEISGWAKNGALFCQTKGLIVGYSNSRFLPQNAATRAEVATVVERFVSSVVQ